MFVKKVSQMLPKKFIAPKPHFKEAIFNLIKAEKFFQLYAPGVTNWKHKLRGVSGRGGELDFTKEDVALIKASLKQLSADLLNSDWSVKYSSPKKKSKENV